MTYPKPRNELKSPDDRSLTFLSWPGYSGKADSTISGKPGIIMNAVKMPASAWPTPIKTNESGNANS